ncbi:MAG: phosphoribosylglycinamide formyltransferase [Verrucomicrobia bacterium]|nr:phosphoribosylglycinamide formyltransferase [Verrucomicrobiota bacterium]
MKLGILASHGGSNAQAIIDNVRTGAINAEIAVVVSNNAHAQVLERARTAGVPGDVVNAVRYPGEGAEDRALVEVLRRHGVELVVLAGYMKRLGPAMLDAFRNRIVNIHPALLPRHGGEGKYGIHVHESVIASGDTETGVTVHLVDEQYDHGAILGQTKLPVEPGDTPETLQRRVLEIEHEFYSEIIGKIADGTIKLA